MSKKLKSSEKIGFFHSVMSKNWTHDLRIFEGAFEGGNQGCKRARRTHFALGHMSKKLKSSEKIWFFDSVMRKNWNHDLLIFKGAFERVNQGCKRANRTHFALGQMRKKLKSSEKIWFFHFVMSKNWTHDLLIFKGAFEGGNQGCKRAREHI